MSISSFVPIPSLASLVLTAFCSAAYAKDAASYVDMHAVILLDVSESVGESEIASAIDGVKAHFLSDDAKIDYEYGIRNAVTLVYFAGGQIIQETTVIDSESTLGDFLSTFLEGRTFEEKYHGMDGSSGWVKFSTGEKMDADTDVPGAMNAAIKVLDGEAELGVYSERRVVLLVGDQLYKGQQDHAIELSAVLKQDYGASFCAVSVENDPENQPPYDLIVTYEAKLVTRSDGASVYVRKCDVENPKTTAEVTESVSRVLGSLRL